MALPSVSCFFSDPAMRQLLQLLNFTVCMKLVQSSSCLGHGAHAGSAHTARLCGWAKMEPGVMVCSQGHRYHPADVFEMHLTLKDAVACALSLSCRYYKVLLCTRRAPHEWKSCPYAHPGELVRRRPLECGYSPVPCPSLRNGSTCPRGDECRFAHGCFETWLHPERYRTQMCSDGAACKRKVHVGVGVPTGFA